MQKNTPGGGTPLSGGFTEMASLNLQARVRFFNISPSGAEGL